MLPDYSPKDLALYRIDKTARCLQSAERALSDDDFETAANRSYYCIFSAMRTVLALDRFDSKKHSGVIAEFRKSYIKTGVFPVTFSDTIQKAFEVRNESDYNDFYLISKADIASQVENAKVFLKAVEKYVNERVQKDGM
jgi:uncharacterized protein (UPF0332 family)